MSRAVNTAEAPEKVRALCDKHGIAISVLEPLPSGGTRVVLVTPDGAAAFRMKGKDKLLDGPVARSGLYLARRPEPTYR
ncbi:MAG: hypothetical protein QHC40_00120 [Sphingobium sp.]|nr:hypothetical protein [Sphingobium sp.]